MSINVLTATSRFRLVVFNMLIRVITGGKICAADTVLHIHLVQFLLSSNKLTISELYFNFFLLAVRSSCSRWASFFRFIAMSMCAVSLPSLISIVDIRSSLCVDSVSDMAPAYIVAVGAGGVPWFPPRTRLKSIFADGLRASTPAALPFYQRG